MSAIMEPAVISACTTPTPPIRAAPTSRGNRDGCPLSGNQPSSRRMGGKGQKVVPSGAKNHGWHLVEALIHAVRKGRAEDEAQGSSEHHPAEIFGGQGPKIVPHVQPEGALHPDHDVNDDHAGEQPAKGAIGQGALKIKEDPRRTGRNVPRRVCGVSRAATAFSRGIWSWVPGLTKGWSPP